ncbi:MAG: hypothetical protein NWE87_01325 [Candidatus Bathyarchaeota archaeon]|nr:hypothetical protein [Candidatus Bathyarchaeota archaeon]
MHWWREEIKIIGAPGEKIIERWFNYNRRRLQKMSTRRNQSLFQELREEINRIEVINSHEHQIPQSELRKSEMNLFKLLMEGGYVGSDVISSGLPEGSLVSCNTPEDYWKKLKAYLPNVDNCFYFRCQLRAYRDLYNFEDDEITEDNWRSLSNKINQAYKRDDWARYVLKIRGNIYKSIVDLDGEGTNPDPELYVHVVRMDDFIQGQCLANRQQLEQRYGQTIYSFDSYLNLLDTVFEKALKDKVVGIKTALAYQRTLSYDNVSKHEAEKVFNKSSDFISSTEAKLFQDYMMHAAIQNY